MTLTTQSRLLTAALLLATASTALAQENGRCGAGKDLIVQALEAAGPQSPNADFETALQHLKRASALCSNLGDAWYFRSLVETRLGHASLAAFALGQAKLLGSETMTQGLQPFVLATPTTTHRGLPTATTSPTTNSPSAVQQKWALVIGISKFADRAIPSLNYTSADAKSFAAMLLDPAIGRFPKANVHTLTDDQATTKNVKEELNWIARHAQPSDMVVIYLATHGSPRETDSVNGINYLITYDTEIKNLDKPDEDALYATAFPMVDLSGAVASRMRALRTLVVLDTCYSGGSINKSNKIATRMMGAGLANASPSAATLDRLAAGSGRIVFAAARVDQESLESDALRHGYFTYFLLKRLTESKGLTPLTQVFASVQQDVSARVATDNKSENLHQDPVMDRSSDDADFALGLTPSYSAVALGAQGNNSPIPLPSLTTLLAIK